MKIKVGQQEHFNKIVKEVNNDRYSAECVNYAVRWANLIETEMANGKKLIEIAESTSSKADISGITGFMYGAAVNILSNCWEYGEELRKWHNKEYNYEGKGIVNPAIFTIKNKGE